MPTNIIDPIQQLLSAQRIATVQQQSKVIAANLVKDATNAGLLSTGNHESIISSLKIDQKLVEDMQNHLIVSRFLLIKYSKDSEKIKLTHEQLKIAIIEVRKEISVIELQPSTPELVIELAWTKKFLKKLYRHYFFKK
jgi:hypothetical protein